MLSDAESDSDVESLHHITINEHYAKAFEYKKEREELEKLKEKYGSDAEEDDDESETDSEEAESEDEDGEELTPAVDAAILRTLARIKRKDPEIYNAETNVFGEEQQKIGAVKVSRGRKDKQSKPVTMRQVALESALNPDSRSPSPQPLPHVEEQRALRSETIAAFHHAVEDDEGDDDDDDKLLIPREKTKDEREKEEEEYRAFLEREVGRDLKDLITVDADDDGFKEKDVDEDSDAEKKKMKKKKKKDKSKENSESMSKRDDDQEFLMNYILNRGWIDRSVNHVPTYGEVTSKKKGKGKAKQEDSDSDDPEGRLPTADADIDEDDFEEIVDRFESSYNFRFEEPDAAVIKGFPRNLPSLVRREDTTRKDARERKKQRKEEELAKKKEEVRRLKGLKMKEIRAKLEKIGREGGLNVDENAALQELDLEGDWDPEAHDRQMNGLYGDEDDEMVDERPQWDGDIDIGDIPISDDDAIPMKISKKKKKKKGKEPEENDGVDIDAMDADAERIDDDEEWDGTEEMRKRKLDEYMEELYGLDFNDLVGDMPTRFKYVPVPKQDFALTPVEILMATDQELNEYMSVKKYAPYRKDAKWDSTRVDRLKNFKAKVTERIPTEYATGSSRKREAGDGNDRPPKKRKGKKERMKMKSGDGGESEEDAKEEEGDAANSKAPPPVDIAGEDVQEGTGKKKRRRRKKAGAQT